MRLNKYFLSVVAVAVMLAVAFLIGCSAHRQASVSPTPSQTATNLASLEDTAVEAELEEAPPIPEPHGRYPGKPIKQFLDHMEWSEANGGKATIEDEHYLMALDATIRIVEGRKEHPEWRWKAVVARFMNWYPGNIEGLRAWRKYDKLLEVLDKAGYKEPDVWPSKTSEVEKTIKSLKRDGFKKEAKELY